MLAILTAEEAVEAVEVFVLFVVNATVKKKTTIDLSAKALMKMQEQTCVIDAAERQVFAVYLLAVFFLARDMCSCTGCCHQL